MSKTTVFHENASTETVAIFCRSEDVPSFKDAFNRLGRLAATISAGGPKEAAEWCTGNCPPAILAVDISREAHPAMRLGELGSIVGPGCRLIALGNTQDVSLYRKLLQAGVFDYITTPLQLGQLSDVLNRADKDLWLGQPQPGSVRAGRTLAVVGATGGVGTSTIVTALGRQFAEVHKTPTVLVDYDRRKSNLALLLGLEANSGLAGILAAPEIDLRLIQRALLTQEGEANSPNRLQLLAQRPGEENPVDSDLLLQLGIALCELYSISIWDIPSHRPTGSDDLLAHSDIRIIVTDYTLQNARATRMLLEQFGDESQGQRLYLVANSTRNLDKPILPRAQFEEFLNWRIDFELPHAGSVLDESLLQGSLNPAKARAFSDVIGRLACSMLGLSSAPAQCPGIFKRLRRTIRIR